jgi:hypothetical protein
MVEAVTLLVTELVMVLLADMVCVRDFGAREDCAVVTMGNLVTPTTRLSCI